MNTQKKKDISCFITRFELIFCSTLQFQLAAINRYLPFQYFFLGKTIFQFQQKKPKRILLWQPLFFKLRLDTFHTSLNSHYDTQSYKKKRKSGKAGKKRPKMSSNFRSKHKSKENILLARNLRDMLSNKEILEI